VVVSVNVANEDALQPLQLVQDANRAEVSHKLPPGTFACLEKNVTPAGDLDECARNYSDQC
jgi:hypothetical protein